MATGKLIGNSDAYNAGGAAPDYFLLFKHTAEYTGTLSEIRFYVGVAGNAKVGFYADNAGEPGARLAKRDTSTAVVVGWNTLTLESPCSVTKDSVYWLAFNIESIVQYGVGTTAGPRRYKVATYSTFTFPDPAGSGFTADTVAPAMIQGWGVLVLSPSSIIQPVSYGTPTVATAALIIYPSSIVQAIAYGTPSLLYPQTLLPSSIIQAIAYGTPSLLYPQTLLPSSIIQAISIGTPTVQVGTPPPQTLLPSSIIQAITYGTPWVRLRRLLAPTRVANATRVLDATRIASRTREVEL